MRGRALTLLTLAGIVVLVAFTGFAVRLAEDAVRDQAEERVRATAVLSARLVGEQQLRFEEVVAAYAGRIRGPGDARATLRALISEVAGLESAVLTDREGRLLDAWPTTRRPRRLDLSGREWFRALRANPRRRSYSSRAYRSSSAGAPKITVAAVPVAGVGVLAASEDRRTQAFADTYGGDQATELTITDQAGVVVGRTGRATDQLLSRAKDPRVRAALAGRSGVEVDDGRVIGYAPVARSGWTVTAAVRTEDAFADVSRLRVALVAGAAIVGFLLLWLLPLLSARLGRAREALGVQAAFQRDLLPAALPDGVRSHYVASERRMLLGGDFLDAIRTPDGSLALLMGDVCGHGPRSAALGARLRAGWRTLALEGGAVDRLATLERLVVLERADEDLYATVACAVVAPDGRSLRYAVGGHPPLLLVAPDTGVVALDEARGPALGLETGLDWPVATIALPVDWTLLLYTDGLIETPVPGGDGTRPGVRGLVRTVTSFRDGAGVLDLEALLAHVRTTTRAEDVDDDVALLAAVSPRGPSRRPASALPAGRSGAAPRPAGP